MFEKDKNTVIQFRLKEKEKKMIEEAAKLKGLTVTDFIKEAIKEKIENENKF